MDEDSLLENIIQLILNAHPQYNERLIRKWIRKKRNKSEESQLTDVEAARLVARAQGLTLPFHFLKSSRTLDITLMEEIDSHTREVALRGKVVRCSRGETDDKTNWARLTIADQTDSVDVLLWDLEAEAVIQRLVTVGTIIEVEGMNKWEASTSERPTISGKITRIVYEGGKEYPEIEQGVSVSHFNHPEGLIHRTLDGVLVRSLDEVKIANRLFEKGIEYGYEVPLVDPKDAANYILPDFTLELAGETYYWEHLGMISDEKYKQKWDKKFKWYGAMTLLSNLIVTKGKLTIEDIEEALDDYLPDGDSVEPIPLFDLAKFKTDNGWYVRAFEGYNETQRANEWCVIKFLSWVRSFPSSISGRTNIPAYASKTKTGIYVNDNEMDFIETCALDQDIEVKEKEFARKPRRKSPK